MIPKTVRESRHWCVGTTFVVQEVPQGILLQPVSSFMPSRLEDVMGCAAYRGPPLSQSQIGRALHADVARPCASKGGFKSQVHRS